MRSRWSDTEAPGAAAGDDPAARRALLVYATRLLGAEPDLAMHGAGNTSCKSLLPRAGDEPCEALVIKASGSDLAKVEDEDFVALDRQALLELLDRPGLDDATMAAELPGCALRSSARRPSIETPFHALLPHAFVAHTHPSAVLALCNRVGGPELVRAALGAETAVVPYAPIGIELGRAVRRAVGAAPAARALVLMHHGLVTWGETARAAYEATIAAVTRAEAQLDGLPRRECPPLPAVPVAERERRYRQVAPLLRSGLAAGGGVPPERLALAPIVDLELAELVEGTLGHALADSAPLTPDCLLRTRRVPLWLDEPSFGDPERFAAAAAVALAAWQARYRAELSGRAAGPAAGPLVPRVVVVPGLGLIAVGKTDADARMVRDLVGQGLRVKATVWRTGGEYQSMTGDQMTEMELRLGGGGTW